MRVLIVDDSIAHTNSLTGILAELGHQVVGNARNGSTAVRMFEKLRPDLVLLDIVMPQMDGLAALRLIRSLDAQAKVIVLSSVAGVGGQVDQALKLGALAVSPKPVSRDRLATVLAKAGCA